MPQITRTKLGAANFGPWENIVRVLILVWFMLYTLNAIPDIHPLVGRIVAKVNYWISYFFMFEYILRVLCAKPRKAYIFSGMGILDFIVCVPFLGMFSGQTGRFFIPCGLSAYWLFSSWPGLMKPPPVLKGFLPDPG